MKALETVTRISLKNILYTTDFSPTAEAAAPYAWELAKRYGAKVIALHVRPVEVNGMVPPESWAAVHEANELQAKQQAGHLKTLFRGIENEVEVTEGGYLGCDFQNDRRKESGSAGDGNPWPRRIRKNGNGIPRGEYSAPLTCAGSGRSGRTFGASRKRRARMKRILFATDFSEASLAALPHAISLAEENQAELDILRVVPPQKSGELVQSERPDGRDGEADEAACSYGS